MNEFNNIPNELKELPQWVCHRAKRPINPCNNNYAKAGQPQTWSTFDQAITAYKKNNHDGIGFQFNNNGIVGVDLDKVINEDGTLKPEAAEIVETLDSYTELSPSKRGLHILVKGDIPSEGRRMGFLEIYKSGRYFTVTGNIYGSLKPIKERTEQLKQVWEKYFSTIKDENKAGITYDTISNSLGIQDKYLNIGLEKDQTLIGMWNGIFSGCKSESEKDLALLGKLLYWCCGDINSAISAFKRSTFALSKDANHLKKMERSDYLLRTANKALTCLISTAAQDDKNFRLKHDVQEFTLDDMGNAQRLMTLFGNDLRYSYIKNSWFYWNSKVWLEDETGEINRLADRTVEEMYKEALKVNDQDKRDKLLKHASRTRSLNRRKAMIEGLKHISGIPALPEDFDRDQWLLNVQNGILNLKSGELRPHDPNKMMTQICNADYLSKATCPKWLEFLNTVTDGNAELIRYLQKAVGYSLTGNTGEECLFILYGKGRNGKGTFAETLLHLLGSYGKTAQVDSIMLKNAVSSGANPDIARLKGARFVNAAEPQKNARLNESLVKQLTGGDMITARFLYGREFEYRPEFKLWINTNYKPQISGNDDGIWNRVKLLPFIVYIPPEKRDKNLKEYLREKELNGILTWAVEGCRLVQKEGLAMPSIVKNAVNDYRSEMDIWQKFIDDCTRPRNNSSVSGQELYKTYNEWCIKNGEYTLSNTKFGREICRYLDKRHTRNGVEYLSIILNTQFENPFT